MKLNFTALGLLLLFVGFAVPQAFSQMCVPPPKGMISWWTGDGTTLDYFGRNDGLTTFPVAYASGEVADAFSFTGTQVVQVLQSASLEPAQITVDAWVNSPSSPGLARYVVSKGGLGDLESSYALYTGASGGLQFYVFDGTVVTLSPDAGAGIWDGKWHHVAGTYDQTAVRLFLDGAEVGTGTPATTPIAYDLTATIATNDLFIGDYNPFCTSCLPHAFTGEVDEVELFGRALPQERIAHIFKARQAGKCLPVKVDIDRDFRGDWRWDFDNKITVTIFGSPAFSAAEIVQTTLHLFPEDDRYHHARAEHCHLEDVNADTFPDLVCRFHAEEPRHRDHDETILVIGRVLVPGGERTFFGSDSFDSGHDGHR